MEFAPLYAVLQDCLPEVKEYEITSYAMEDSSESLVTVSFLHQGKRYSKVISEQEILHDPSFPERWSNMWTRTRGQTEVQCPPQTE